MTPQEHAHAQALNEWHDFYGGRPTKGVDPYLADRDRWVAAREKQLTTTTTAAGGTR
jgi:hypothetical protein